MIKSLWAVCLRLQSQLLFIAVGVAAALVHLSVVWLLVHFLATPPLAANPLGFFIAFWVSFFGHRHGSFRRDEPHELARSLPRFAVVAVAGFLVNEALYAALLAWTPLPYAVALFLVIGMVAVLTYLSSKHWAFAQTA
jgi:putative flippase GtrA